MALTFLATILGFMWSGYPMQRFPRYCLLATALVAVTLLATSFGPRFGNGAAFSRSLYDWDIPQLADQLNRMGVQVRLRSVPKDVQLRQSAFLTSIDKDWRELNVLSKDARRISEWRGILYCEYVGEDDCTHLIEQWGDHCLLVGPYLFYGDVELLDHVRAALTTYAPFSVLLSIRERNR